MGQDTSTRRTQTFTNHGPWLQVIITVMCQCHWLRISKPIHTFVYISLPQSSSCQNHNKVTGIKSTRLEQKAYQKSKPLIPVDVGNLWKLFTQLKLSNKQLHLCHLHLHSISHHICYQQNSPKSLPSGWTWQFGASSQLKFARREGKSRKAR